MDLLKRREEILAEHRAQEKYDPYWLAEANAGRKLSERPIAFLCDDEIVILSACVGKVLEALRQFVAAATPIFADPEAVLTQENYKRHAFAKAKLLLSRHGEEPPSELRVPQQTWSAITHGLAEAGVLAVTTEGTHV